MSMVCGLDLHRGQITFDVVEVDSGEAWRGRLWRPDRQRLRSWLRDEVAPRAGDGSVAIAVEGCTGWRFVVEEVRAAGFEAHVAEPGDTQAMRGRKKHAKTDRTDARLLRDLLAAGDLPESWIPPEAVLEWRERCRLYKSLIDQRRVWVQRIHAELYQHGVALPDGEIRADDTRELLVGWRRSVTDAARERIRVGYRMIDVTHDEAQVLSATRSTGSVTRQPGCRALVDALYGVGPLTAVVLWSELGDCARFTRSRQVVRHTGLDVTVDASDTHRGGGHLSRQGPGTLRWALFEAGMYAARATSPDRDYYQAVKARHDGKLAAIAVARKLARRSYHILRSIDPDQIYALPAT